MNLTTSLGTTRGMNVPLYNCLDPHLFPTLRLEGHQRGDGAPLGSRQSRRPAQLTVALNSFAPSAVRKLMRCYG